ncbi:MAG: ATP-binding protein [Caldilineaceae bacterium]
MPRSDTIRIDLPAQYRYLNVVSACIRAVLERFPGDSISTEVVYHIQLAVHELCNNIVEHAYGHEEGQLQIRFCIPQDHQALIIDLYDTGAPFNPTAVVQPTLTAPQVEGYGLFLAHQMLDEIHYKLEEEQNHWHLEKYL